MECVICAGDARIIVELTDLRSFRVRAVTLVSSSSTISDTLDLSDG